MNILGIETSCDETSASVVCNGRKVLSNVVFSQIDLHGHYGGVVPEIASRCHVEVLPGVVEEAVKKSGLCWSDINMVAFTYGPGLASSLLVGISAAKSLALRLNKPLCAVNHLEAHIYSVFLGEDMPEIKDICPFVALIISGGHTCLVRVEGIGNYKLLGQTIDDAAGEAFDKGANLLNMGYPGGPLIDKISKDGDRKFVHFPRARAGKEKILINGLHSELCFSFSGLKTSLLYYLKDYPYDDDHDKLSSIAASYQEAIVDAVIKRCSKAIQGEKYLVVGGGVSLNSRLRSCLKKFAKNFKINLILAEPEYCADNAAMVAGFAGAGGGMRGDDVYALDASPNLNIS